MFPGRTAPMVLGCFRLGKRPITLKGRFYSLFIFQYEDVQQNSLKSSGGALCRSDPAAYLKSERTRFHFFPAGFIIPKLRSSAIPASSPHKVILSPKYEALQRGRDREMSEMWLNLSTYVFESLQYKEQAILKMVFCTALLIFRLLPGRDSLRIFGSYSDDKRLFSARRIFKEHSIDSI